MSDEAPTARLDPAMIEALHARMDGVARLGIASALRMHATTMRTQGDLLLNMARTIEDQADRIEAGREDPPARPMRLVPVPEDPPAAPADEAPPRKPGQVERIDEASGIGVFVPAEVTDFSPQMLSFLDLFDDRLRLSPHFIQAVNEAAHYGVPLTGNGARVVAARVEELTQLAEAGEGGADG